MAAREPAMVSRIFSPAAAALDLAEAPPPPPNLRPCMGKDVFPCHGDVQASADMQGKHCTQRIPYKNVDSSFFGHSAHTSCRVNGEH